MFSRPKTCEQLKPTWYEWAGNCSSRQGQKSRVTWLLTCGTRLALMAASLTISAECCNSWQPLSEQKPYILISRLPTMPKKQIQCLLQIEHHRENISKGHCVGALQWKLCGWGFSWLLGIVYRSHITLKLETSLWA